MNTAFYFYTENTANKCSEIHSLVAPQISMVKVRWSFFCKFTTLWFYSHSVDSRVVEYGVVLTRYKRNNVKSHSSILDMCSLTGSTSTKLRLVQLLSDLSYTSCTIGYSVGRHWTINRLRVRSNIILSHKLRCFITTGATGVDGKPGATGATGVNTARNISTTTQSPCSGPIGEGNPWIRCQRGNQSTLHLAVLFS